MTDPSPVTPTPASTPVQRLEQQLLDAALPLIPDLGLNSTTLNRAARQVGLSKPELDLICPNGPRDIAALIWRRDDDAFLNATDAMGPMKIREKIAYLLTARLDIAATDLKVLSHLMGYLSLPQHLGLCKRLVWHTSDLIWRRAGDQSLDENHYSKRLIVSGIVSSLILTRITAGKTAQDDQIRRNINAVMAFEKVKAQMHKTTVFTPEQAMLKVAGVLGRLRFGKTPAA